MPDLPVDPFSPQFGEGFDDLPATQQALLREFVRARQDASVLSTMESFRELIAAVSALDDVRARAVLVSLFTDMKVASDPNWRDWMMAP